MALVLIMSSCGVIFYPKGSLGSNQHYEAQAILCAGVPYYYDSEDDAKRFDQVRVLETDSQGRQLFEYVCTASYYWESIIIWVICQHKSQDAAFYYEDIAYRMVFESDTTELSHVQMNTFKEQNDWDSPLNLDKARCVSFPYSRTNNANKAVVNETIKEYYSLDDTWAVEFDDLETYDQSKRVLIVRLYTNPNVGATYQRSYLVVYEHSSTTGGRVLASQPYEETLNCQAIIHQFKVAQCLLDS